MNTLLLLLKREYWEHRGGFLWAPVWIMAFILGFTLISLVIAEILHGSTSISVGMSLEELRRNLADQDLAGAGNALDLLQLTLAGIAAVGVFFVSFFYLLGTLYDDRRDRSVLFWKSLPISDRDTVVSKALAALLLIPLLALAIATLAHVLLLAIIGTWTLTHGLNFVPAILASHPLGMFLRLAGLVLLGTLWALPTVGWLLLCSAWARSKPFLWAVLLPVLTLILSVWVGMLGAPSLADSADLAHLVGRLLFSIMPGGWLNEAGIGAGSATVSFGISDEHVLMSLAPARFYGLLASADLWLGVLAGIAAIAAAIWLRGRRIETSV